MAVKPGDPILQHLTAAWFNKLSTPQRNIGGGAGIDSFDHLIITVRNHEDVKREVYSPVHLDTPYFDYDKVFDTTHQTIVINTRTDPTPSDSFLGFTRWAILQEPLAGTIGATAKALMKGITWLQYPTDDIQFDSNNYLLKSSATKLDYAHEGRVQILFTASVDDLTYFLVSMGNMPVQRTLFFELGEDMASYTSPYSRLTARASAAFYNFYENYMFEDYLYSFDGIVDNEVTGFKGIATLMDNNWIFSQAVCQGIISS